MDTPDQRECSPKSSGANPSLAKMTLDSSILSMGMIYEAMTEWKFKGVTR